VVSGNEFYKGRPIVYGVGNLLFEDTANEPSAWFTGCMVRLQVSHSETPGLEFVPYRQDPAGPTVRLMAGPEREAFLSHVTDLNGIIADEERLAASWSAFCTSRRSHFLGSILCLTRPESWLLDRGLLPTARLRFTQRRLANLQNLFSCESHSESCERMLRDMLGQKGSND
jgi:hypothetical protein